MAFGAGPWTFRDDSTGSQFTTSDPQLAAVYQNQGFENVAGGSPGGAPGGGALTSQSTPAAPVAGDPNAGTPSGLPTPAQVGGAAPAPIQSFGPTPTVTPTYAQTPAAPTAALADPNQNLAYLQQYEDATSKALAPQFQAQQQTLQDQAAARGLTGGAAQYGENQLLQGQEATYASAIQPLISQGYGYTQQDIQGNQNAINTLMAQGYSYEEATTLANTGYANQATNTNAAYYNQDRTGNATAYNNFGNELLGAGTQLSGTELLAYLNSYQPNPGVTGAYNTQIGQTGSIYGNVFNGALQGQNQAIGSAFGAAGAAASGGAF